MMAILYCHCKKQKADFAFEPSLSACGLHNISFLALIILRRVDHNNTTKEEYNAFYVCVKVGTLFLHHQLCYSFSEK